MRRTALTAASVFAAAFSSNQACRGARFVEPGVQVLHTLTDATAPLGTNFGWAVSELRDINNDGADDLIVSCPTHPAAGTGAGKAYVYSGKTGLLIYSWLGAGAGATFGQSIADAGDVDADGTHDIVVGARGGSTVNGRAVVFSGATGLPIRTFTGTAPDLFGFAVAGPGDVNGDGHADIAVSAPTTGAGTGYVSVFSGADSSLLFRVNADAPGGRFGTGLGPAGDVDHDGRGDLILGARDSGPGLRGRAYVLSGLDGSRIRPFLDPDQTTGVDLGWFFVSGCGDVNADGTNDLYAGDFNDSTGGVPGAGSSYVWSGVDGSLLRRFTGAPGDGMGPGRGARDIDGDGLPDVVLGLYTNSTGAGGAGAIEVRSAVSGDLIRRITSTTASEAFGFDAVGIGDVNNDCSNDLLVSAASRNTVYVIAGVPRPVVGDLNADRRVDTQDLVSFLGQFGQSVTPGTAADLNADGVVNVLDLTIFLGAFGKVCA